MKTLAQIEPRTPVSSLPFNITSSGAYYLTTNLTGAAGENGITIRIDHVTLDLNGYVLGGATDALKGIVVAGARKNIVIQNGTVSNWSLGVDASNASNCQFESLRVFENNGAGLIAGVHSIINRCVSHANAGVGIQAGDDAVLNQSSTTANLAGGIVTGSNSSIVDCKAKGNSREGIHAESGSTIRHCTALGNSSDGIWVSSECTVEANNSKGNFNARDAAGIHATATDNCIRENNVVSNDRGISVDQAGNIIIQNTAANNTLNYSLSGSQTLGPIFKDPDAVRATNPWTNFEF